MQQKQVFMMKCEVYIIKYNFSHGTYHLEWYNRKIQRLYRIIPPETHADRPCISPDF